MNNLKFLSLEDYVNKFNPKNPNYILGYEEKNDTQEAFPPKIVKVGMLKWNDSSASSWGGPFEGNYCLCTITDYTHTCSHLKSVSQIQETSAIYEKYSMFNVPRQTLQKAFKNRPDFKDYCFLVKTSKGGSCARTTLTHQEYLYLLNNLTANEVHAWLTVVQDKHPKNQWELQTETIEFPVTMYLCGNDDCSYTKVYDTKESALRELKYLIDKQPDWDYLHDNNFRFTN